MKRSIDITRKAERDIQEATDYLEFELFSPKAVSLAEYPGRHCLVDDPVLRSREIRFFPVDNYIFFIL